jgi:PAS domain S-box-containing protein
MVMDLDRNPTGMHDSVNLTQNSTTHGPADESKKTNLLTAFEHIPIGIAASSPALDGRYIGFNEEFRRFLGYERHELQQLCIGDVTHEDDYAVESKLLSQLLARQIPFYKLQKRYIHKEWPNHPG